MQSILIVLNMFLLESLLSVDNAAALAVIVKDLPRKDRVKALRYGIIGAFAFRAACLLLVGWLVKILWLKVLGGLYLLYLSYKFFFKSQNEENKETPLRGKIGLIRAIILVEMVDIAFSIDNIFAAVAMSNRIELVIIGVCLGIFAMRFIAQWFVALLHSYPSLEASAFVVITLLGLKLVIEGISNYFPSNRPNDWEINKEAFDFIFSAVMMIIFFFPILIRRLLNQRRKEE